MKKSFIRKISTGVTIVSSFISCLSNISYADIPVFSKKAAEGRLGHSLDVITVGSEKHILLNTTELCDFYGAKGKNLKERLEFLKDKVFGERLRGLLCGYRFELTTLDDKSIMLLKYFGCNWIINTGEYFVDHMFYWFPVEEGENLPIVYITPHEYLQLEDENLKGNREKMFENFPDFLEQVKKEENLMQNGPNSEEE